MGKREDNAVEVIVEDWVSVNKFDDPLAWEAWKNWRFSQLRCHIEPTAFTVPSIFPPTTVSAAREYIASLRQIRKAIRWTDSRAKLPNDVSAWMGG